MLPRLDRLSLKPTGEFYALSAPEVAEEPDDPIHGNPFLPGQTRDSPNATFRVRNRDPRPGTTDQYVYHVFEAASLWDWVKREGKAINPKNRDPFWKEDWLALHDRFNPNGPVPDWVRRLPQLDPAFNDPRANAPVATPDPEWVRDVRKAYRISWRFSENLHYFNDMEDELTELRETLHTIRQKYDDDIEGNEYRDPLMTYDNEGRIEGDAHIDIRDLINLLLEIVIVSTAPFRAKTLAIRFVAHFLQRTTFRSRVANCVRDEEVFSPTVLRNGLDRYLADVANHLGGMLPLQRQLVRLDALRIRHHTFWKWPIHDSMLKGPPPPARVLTVWEPDRTYDAAMVLLKETMDAAITEMGFFGHKQDDVDSFFMLKDDAHYSDKTPYDASTEYLDKLSELFRKSVADTQADNGARRAISITFFANVLDVFVELSMWNEADLSLHSDTWNDRVQEWAHKVASTLWSVVRKDDSLPSEEEYRVVTFFWWYVAPLYEMGTASNHIEAHHNTHHLERDDVLKALSLLDDTLMGIDLQDETVERVPTDPPAAHERPAGEATPGRRRQRTEEE